MTKENRDFFNLAMRRFREVTGIAARTEAIDDGAIVFLSAGPEELMFRVLLKKSITQAGINLLITELRGRRENTLLITNFLNPGLRDEIEKRRINFIDAAGNAVIKVPPLFISIKGNKIPRIQKEKSGDRLFYRAGLKVIFALLCNEGAERKTMRELAAISGVTHGAAHLTIKELESRGFIVIENKKKKLVNKKDLLKMWSVHYNDVLKHKLIIGRYRGAAVDAGKHTVPEDGIFYGGETAAAAITGYLQPFIHTVYLSGEAGNFIFKNRLKKDAAGNYFLLKKFWNFETRNQANIAPPVLIYADLIGSGDPRNGETAEIIYENEIVQYFK